jgi:ribosomal protein S18 acetylase RimI-like enzyme
VVCEAAAMTDELSIERGSGADLPALEPIWVSVHHRHQEVMPELAPYVSDEQTWAEHGAFYAQLFDKPGTVLLLARLDGRLVGYGLAHVMPASGSWLGDTWATGARVGEIETLAVLPGHRGRGIGGRLLDGLTRELAGQDVHDLVLGVLPGNSDAIRLYERHGYRPTWLYLSRFAGRPGSPA